MTLQPTQFSIDIIGEDVLFDGFTSEETWNGWDCPYFTFEQGQRVTDVLNTTDTHEEDKVKGYYNVERDAFCFNFESAGECDYFSAVLIDGQKYYPIGADCWIWERVNRWDEFNYGGAI